MRKKTVILLTAALVFNATFAQDSITVKESVQIKYKAESLIKRELKDLLNMIANAETDQKYMKDIIYNAHSGSANKIFDSDKVIIEDDINPSHNSSGNTHDVEVQKYLNDFDLLYSKSMGSSVVFSDIRVSNIKKTARMYVKVYFNSFFRNQNKTVDTPYKINSRVAEIFLTKQNNHWVPYIAKIGFYNPADTATDNLYDIVLKREGNYDAQTLAKDSAAIVAEQISIEEELKQQEYKKQVEDDRKQTLLFFNLIEKGDKALDNNDFTEALENYKQARDLRPYDPLPQSKINNLNNKKVRAMLNKEQLFDEYIAKAKIATLKREYKTAIDYYNKAKNEKPDEGSKYDAIIKELTTKFGNIEELEEKYKAGLYQQTIKEYSALIKKNSTYSDYYLGRGKCYDKVNDYSKALKDYSQAYTLDPTNIEALQYRAELYKRNKDYFKALTDYKLYLINYKENPNVYVEIANLLMQINLNNTNDAIKYLDEGLAIPALQKAAELYLKKGLLQLDKNDFKNASNNFSSVIKIDSNHAFAYYNRGKCQLQLKNVDNAALDFESSRQKGLDSLYLKNIEAYAESYFQRASLKFNDSAKDSAIILASYAIAINPTKSLYRFIRGEYHFSLNNYKEAINSYDQAIELNNAYTDAYYKRGLGYYHLGTYKTAIENFDKAVKLNPQLYLGHKGLGDSYFALKDYGNASINLEYSIKTIIALKTAPNANVVAEVYNVLGKSYYHLNDFQKSIAALKNAVKKNNLFAEAYFNRGLSYYKVAELSEAITDIAKAVSIENKYAEWYYYLSRAYQDKKDYQNAALNYGICITKDSAGSFIDAVYLRGYCNYQLQNYQLAIADYLKTLELNQHTAIPSFNNEMGNIYLNTGKHDSALVYYNKTYSTDPTNGYAMYGIACSFTLKGNTDDALGWFEKSFQSKAIAYNEIKKDKLLATIKNDKRFKELLKKYY